MSYPTLRMKFILSANDCGAWGEDPDSDPGTPVVRSTEIALDGRITPETAAVRKLTAKEFKATCLNFGDILVVKSSGSDAHLGKSGWVDERSAGMSFSNFIQRLRVSREFDPRFTWYFMNCNAMKDQVRILSSTSTGLQNLSGSLIREIEVPSPPLDEQRRIADFLDAETARIDGLLTATNRQLELLTSKRLEAFRGLTTGNYVADSLRATGISWMPHMAKSWKLYKLGRSFQSGSGTTPRASDDRYFDGTHSWINTGDLRDGNIGQPAKAVSDAALREYPTLRIYPVGTLMVAMYGATIGRVGISTVPACVNQACCALTALGNVDVQYAFYWFLAHRTEIMRLGSGGGQPNISQDIIRSLKIPAPSSMAEQQAIVGKCKEIEGDIIKHQKLLARRSALLLERRQALITAAVTGAITV